MADPISIKSYGGVQLRIESRVSDKTAGEIGHPIQYDYVKANWFIHVDATGNTTKTHLYYWLLLKRIITVKRIEDGRSIDEKIYKFRYVVPKELNNARDRSQDLLFKTLELLMLEMLVILTLQHC